jgi:hypothetical protein
MVKLNTDPKVFALCEFAQTETAKMRRNRENISHGERAFLFAAIYRAFGNEFLLASQRNEPGDVLFRRIVSCQRYFHDQGAAERAKSDVYLSGLSHCSDKCVRAKVLDRNWAKAGNSFAFRNCFLIG